MSLTACWAAKGGSGTTVVAAGLALVLAERDPAGALLADLAGDAPDALGLPACDSAGLAGWLAAGDDVPADALRRLEVAANASLMLLPRGAGPLGDDRAEVLASIFEQSTRPVVADCGTRPRGAAAVLATSAAASLLVTRPCYLALRNAVRAKHRPTGVILVREPGRTLDHTDVERALGVPVVSQVAVDPAVARAIDAGSLAAARLPRAFQRALRHAA